ncbi:DUF3097 family protein [Leucobacter denitrificans]|uniref:DUF3097 domain-containing protein n=1 Tax=Leucobacter denitrificans TaxID=683042 RepID=A0A7G9S6G1_9MICO|nr:DUF3097 family protein [Leucobacter denitrificans]QNN63436.1 DUF3097 domain-containing protein [Leucobacter denitrificans]
MLDDRYDNDPIARMKPRRGPVQRTEVPLTRGLVVEHSLTEFCGAVVDARDGVLKLEDFDGAVRSFPLSDGFLVDGVPAKFVAPQKQAAPRRRTASGSFATPEARARVAMPSRIFVEGKHDAELVEQVWGSDLRHEGVVVELLEGADRLEEVLAAFKPATDRRAGVLLDHLVPGSKESRIADAIARGPHGAHTLIVGHPYIDIWEAVKPARLGLEAWPKIPRGTDWKTGICRELGWPAEEMADIADAWSRIRGRVRTFRDLEPELIGRVEHLIDFVTVG